MESSDHATTPAPGRSRHSILGVAAAADPVAQHAGGVTLVRHGPVTVRQEGPWFRWLAGAWPAGGVDRADTVSGTDGTPAPEAPFRSGWMGWLGYGLKREAGSPDGSATLRGDAAGPADALLFRPSRVATVDHRAGTTTLWWSADDDGGASWADRLARAGVTAPHPSGPASPAGPTPVFTLRDSARGLPGQGPRRPARDPRRQHLRVCLTTMLEASAVAPAGEHFDGGHLPASRRGETGALHAVPALDGPGGDRPARPPAVELLSTSPERFLALSAAAAWSPSRSRAPAHAG